MAKREEGAWAGGGTDDGANAAGVDIGATEIYIAVPADRDTQPVRRFAAFTEDLKAAADWLERCRIETVAMESTGVYWIPLFQILEARGMKVCLVNARHVKNVPGRKTDVSDCQWLQYLHAVGLLRASFRLGAGVRGAVADALPGESGGDGGGASAAHAEGAGSDEPATAPCHQRPERDDRDGDSGRDSGRRAQPAEAGPVARPAHQGQPRDDRQVAGRRLPSGTSVYASPVGDRVSEHQQLLAAAMWRSSRCWGNSPARGRAGSCA